MRSPTERSRTKYTPSHPPWLYPSRLQLGGGGSNSIGRPDHSKVSGGRAGGAQARTSAPASDGSKRARRRKGMGCVIGQHLLFLALLILGLALTLGQGLSQTRNWTRERIGLLSLEGPPGTERAVQALAGRAREILPEIETQLGLRPAQRFRIVLVPRGGLDELDLVGMDQAAPPWAAGYMIPGHRIGAIRMDQAAHYPYGTLESVLAHETVHLLLHDALGGRTPLWFEEGVATWQGRRWSAQDMWIYTRSLLTSDLPALADLDSAFRASPAEADLAYAASFAFISWNVRRHGEEWVRRVLRETRSRPFAAAWEAVTEAPLEQAEAAWRKESLIRYRWVPVLTASSTLWLGITLLAVWAGIRKRARAREARERWAAEGLEESAD
jgi:hypothetical protein